ncbi:MAG: formylglycine-generating enzyme family protein [Phycisphaerales bacterium]
MISRAKGIVRGLYAAAALGVGMSEVPVLAHQAASPATRSHRRGDGASQPALEPFKQEIPSAAYAVEMVPVAGDPSRGIKPFWISRTEVTWESFDVFIYKLDEPHGSADEPAVTPAAPPVATTPAVSPDADAVTRPTKPYLPPDRGFGHEGYAAITMSHASATEFCRWLSAKSGRKYRLATEDEWELACGDAPGEKDLAEFAWYVSNAENKPHPVATKKANTHGLHDMLGNVAEWVDGRDGKPVVKGGHYRDSAEALKPEARRLYDRAWNASDPQIPKSKWWLADGPFIGFRIVCEPPVASPKRQPEK